MGGVSGWLVGMELKASIKDQLAPLQLYKLNLIQKTGGIALATCPENWDEIYNYLKILSQQGVKYVDGYVRRSQRPNFRPSYDETGKLLRL